MKSSRHIGCPIHAEGMGGIIRAKLEPTSANILTWVWTSVELVIRTEEVFNINIDNYDAEKVQTVGDLYELVCKLLNVSPTPNPQTPTTLDQPPPRKYDPLKLYTAEDIWIMVVAIIEDQLQVDVSEIRYNASFQSDLGAD